MLPLCVTAGFLVNDGRILTSNVQPITYVFTPYFLRSIGWIWISMERHYRVNRRDPSGVSNRNSAILMTVYNVVRTSDFASSTGPGVVHDLFVGLGFEFCRNPIAIEQNCFSLTPGCGVNQSLFLCESELYRA